MKSRGAWLVWLALLLPLSGLLGCGGSPAAPQEDPVFYLNSSRGVIDPRYAWERYFPPLDREAADRLPQRVGVAVLEGDVRLSRPIDWSIRTADYRAERRLISYQSPRQFVFNIFERIDPPYKTWAEVLGRYENDVLATGSEMLSKRLPVATANAQGRSYLVKTKLDGNAGESFAHEIIVRSRNRILLVQIVHGEDYENSADEMIDAVRSMLVY